MGNTSGSIRGFMGIQLIESGRPTVTSGQAGAIMGFSRWTLLRRLYNGMYSHVGRCKLMSGWIFDMEDMVRLAFPAADDAQVTMLMKEYREKFAAAKRRKPR